MRHPLPIALSVISIALAAPASAVGQVGEMGEAGVLREHHPEVHALVQRLETAHGVLLAGLAEEGATVRASGDDLPTYDFEFDMIDRLTTIVHDPVASGAAADEAERGYETLGPRAAAVVRWGQAFQREALAVLADPEVADPSSALSALLARYRSRPELALPTVPKDMDILYDHAYAFGFRTGYADLDGFLWAGHWLRLAATEPMTDLEGEARRAGLDTVSTRYYAKLTYGEPPDFFPSEIPLAPAIAPGLIWLSPETAMVWDNLSMLLEVLADVLASPDTPDVPAAIDATVDFFLDPELAVTDQDEWEIMALRHGIFYQGGFPLAVMTESERNVGGHAAHLAEGGGAVLTIPGMPRR